MKSLFKRKLAWGFYIGVLLVLVCLCVHRYKNPYDVELLLEGDGGLSTESFELSMGSYTLGVSYKASSQQVFELLADDNQPFFHGNRFDLSKNKEYLNYHFYTTHKIDSIRGVADFDGNGDFYLTKVEIHSNVRCYLVAIVAWSLFSVLAWLFFGLECFNRNRNVLWAIIAISLFGSIGIFMKGQIFTHDYGFHLARIEGIAQGLKSGQFPVRMNPAFNDGYGYPTSIFYGDLLLYMPAMARILGFSVISSYKMYVLLISFITTVFCYYSARSIFNNSNTALVVWLSYVMANYRLLDVFGRTAVGEYTALAFYPLIFLVIYRLYFCDSDNNGYKRDSLLLAASMAALLYTHLLSLEMVSILLTVFAIVFFKKTFRKEILLSLVKAVIIFILLGLSFLVPFIDYYVNTDTYIKYVVDGTPFIQENGAYLSDYFAFLKKFTGGTDYNIKTRMQFTPGIVLMGVLILAVFLIVNHKADKTIKAMTVASLLILFLASNIFPWDNLSYMTKIGRIMAQVQFPWRYLGVGIILLSFLLGFIMESGAVNKAEITKVVIAASILMAGVFISVFGNISVQSTFIDFPEMPQYTYGVEYVSGLGASEYLIVGTDMDKLDYYVMTDQANAWIENEKGVNMDIHVEADGNAFVEVPRFNYRNYVACDTNGNKYQIVSGTNNKIRILFGEPYEGTISLKYIEPAIWRISEIISLLTVACCVFAGSKLFLVRRAKLPE